MTDRTPHLPHRPRPVALAQAARVVLFAVAGAVATPVVAQPADLPDAGWRIGLEASPWQITSRLGLTLASPSWWTPVDGRWGRVDVLAEFTAMLWRYPSPVAGERDQLAGIGITPVVRWRPSAASAWHLEAGIGANWLSERYRTDRREFSTRFQFGDLIGVGWQFGARRQWEVGYRLIHYSNAGIERPNPGENFHVLVLRARID